MQLGLTIENLADGARTFDVELSGVDAEWIKASRHEVRLDEGEVSEVLIQLRPPRGPEMKPGRYVLLVTITPHDAPEQAVQQTRHVEIASYHGLTLAVRPASQSGAFNVVIENQGNVAANVQLGGWHLKSALKYEFAKTRLSLAPGKSGEVNLRVRPRQGKRLREPTTFAVVARSLDASGYQAAVPAHYAGSG